MVANWEREGRLIMPVNLDGKKKGPKTPSYEGTVAFEGLRAVMSRNPVKTAREAHGATQAEFAAVMGVSVSTVSRWEASGMDMSEENIQRATDIFDPAYFAPLTFAQALTNWRAELEKYR